MKTQNKDRPHPGSLLKVEIIKPNGLNITKAAELLEISRVHLSNIINGNDDLTYKMCCKLEVLFGQNAETWATRQMQYDLEKARNEVSKMDIRPYKNVSKKDYKKS